MSHRIGVSDGGSSIAFPQDYREDKSSTTCILLFVSPKQITSNSLLIHLNHRTLFGYSAENRGVGITGGVDYVDLDGPMVLISLKGRFWHERTTVLDRVSNYLIQRIPEIIEVNVEDPWQLSKEANEVF